MRIAKKDDLNSVTHSVRASQAVLQYGVGAMVDFPDQTLMTAAPEYWATQIIQIHDERLEKVLNVDFFGMPGGKDEAQFREGISYARFPEWYFCPKCRRLQPLSKWKEEYKRKASAAVLDKDPHMVKHMRCQNCKQELVVARILTVCEDGHIDDFPWVEWAHQRNMGGAKPICSNPSLTFKTGASSTEGLEGLVVTCESCHAKATLREAFDPTIFKKIDEKAGTRQFICKGRHPWKNTREKCGKHPRAIQRGSSSVYFPVTLSSLVIPPFSDILNTKIESSNAFQNCKTTLSNVPPEIRGFLIQSQLGQWSENIALEIGEPSESVSAILSRKWCSSGNEEYTTQSVKYRAEEYEALNGTAGIGTGISRDFSRETMDITLYDIPYVVNVSLIHKIREVQALTGFSRLRPVEWGGQAQSPEGFVPIKEKSTRWYPAYEVRGEGIFIEFDQSAISTWASENSAIQRRVDILNANYATSFLGQNNPRKIDAKFLMLHTLAHLLIKQLSFECGYSIASLKERIYCSNETDGKEMSGILIYTASGDSEGTMGGLVRQGRPDCLPKVFKKALEGAITCSNDPVCSLSEGQGRESLNMSACYSCALIPETSCEEYNIFLDRGVLIGTYRNPQMGFFCDRDSVPNSCQSPPITSSLANTTTETQENRETVLIQRNGTKLSNMSLQDIWSYVLSVVDNPTEHETELFDSLISLSSGLPVSEVPLQGEVVKTLISGETIETDIVWEKAHVMVFVSDNKENYLRAIKTNWKCYYMDDPNITATEILNALKGD